VIAQVKSSVMHSQTAAMIATFIAIFVIFVGLRNRSR
jgi:hypothetical protein